MMRALVPALTLVVAACHGRADKTGEPAVSHAWIRLSPVPGRPAAGYATLRAGAGAIRLTGVRSAVAVRIEMHEGGMADGMMTMRPLAAVDVPAGGAHAFRPGGDHLMLFGVAASVAPGGLVPLSFGLTDGRMLTASARVIGAGDVAPAGE